MKVLAIIPAFNEEACIEASVAGLLETCQGIDYLIVDDGSSDRTTAICKENNYNYISLPTNCGLSCAFKTGMEYARDNSFDIAVQFDADGQHLPSYIAPMYDKLETDQADVVIASRYLDGASPTGARGLGSRLITWLIKTTTGVELSDPTSGMRMYNRKMIELFADSFDMAPEPDALALIARKGGKVVEIPAKMQERQGGESYFDIPHIVVYMARTCMSILLFQWLR